MPVFPGPEGALLDTIKRYLTYPPMERDNHIQGTVIVGFVINEDGSVSDAKIKKGVSIGLDKEAKRVVKKLKFNPGIQDGKAVRVSYEVPIEFILK
jgi:protein TonB